MRASALSLRITGFAPANHDAWSRERRVALVVVTVPFLCLASAVALSWGWGIRPVDLLLLGAMYSITVIGIGVGFHRLISHKAFTTSSNARLVLCVLGSMAAQGPALYWAAIHRRHHSFADHVGDPHSPHLGHEGAIGWLQAFWHAHTGWLFDHEITDWVHYIPDLLRDRRLFRCSRLYFLWVALGIAIPGAIGFVVTPTLKGALLGMFWGGLVRIALVHHTTWSVNSICHLFGTRPYATTDHSRNNLVIALLAFGEGWHNNHHAFPSSAMHGLRWWQIDICGYVIQLMQTAGMASGLKRPPAEKIV
jgi:stearoyl-CoA desaturase (delta-9 desaturase)